MTHIVLEITSAASKEALWAMSQYFAELDARFDGGFDAAAALEEAVETLDPPSGLFVVARVGDSVVGCGALMHLDGETSEVKRMWVSDGMRGEGLGGRLLRHLEQQAALTGRQRVVLDTNRVLAEAIAMYERNGYRAIERYNDNPYAHHWFAKDLA